MTRLAQVIGFGPAALGLPLAAERMGQLDRLGDLGIDFVDRAQPDSLKTLRFPFVVESNSPARDFLACVDRTGRFASALHRPAGRRLAEYDDRQIPLPLVQEFLADVAEQVQNWLHEGAGRVHHGCDVAQVRLDEHGTYTSLTAEGRVVTRSHAVVFATGAEQDARELGLPPERVLPSAAILAGELEPLIEAVAAGGQVVIVGGSHSGFAVADLLIERLGDAIGCRQVTVIHRGIAVGFQDLDEALSMSDVLALAPAVVCQDTGLVNRFSGLRGRARQLCLRVLSGAEHRVWLCPADGPAAEQALRGAAVVVHAAGYRSVVPKLIGADDQPIELRRSHGYVAVDSNCQVFSRSGVLPGAYAIGIGSARPNSQGERQVALNVFHGQDAQDTVAGLLQRLPHSTERTPHV
jgi:hypothetical protein